MLNRDDVIMLIEEERAALLDARAELAAGPEVAKLVAEAEARGMERAAEMFAEMWRENDGYRIAKIRAEAAAIRRAAEETGT